MVKHVHGGSEQHALIGLARTPGDELRQECFPHTRIADKNDVGSLGEEREVEQTQEPRFGLHTAFMVMEVKGIDAGLGLEARASEAPFDGALRARFDFHVGEPFERGRCAETLGGSFSQSRLELAAHGGQIQLIQLLLERSHEIPFRG